MSYTPRRLGHVNMFCRNVEVSKKWYEDLLGLHCYDYTPGRVAFLSADLEASHEIALGQLGDDAPLQQKGQVGLNHMCWYMETLDDLAELYHRIKELNIPIEFVSDHGVSIGIYLRDPDGNGVEVSYEMPRKDWGREENIFLAGGFTERGRLSGPWDGDLANDPISARLATSTR